MTDHTPTNVPYTTRTGVQIGLLYKRPPPATYRDGDRLQRALLLPDDDPMEDLGKLAVALLGLIAASVCLIVLFLFLGAT